MSTVKRIAKNTTVLFIAQMITYLMGFFITMYTARYLGAEGFGNLSIALALTGIFAVLTDLGIGTLTVRAVSRDKSLTTKYVANTMPLRLILSIITILLIVITVNMVSYSPQVRNVIYIISLSVLIGVISGIFYCIFQAYEKMEYQSISTILNSVVMLGGTITVIYFKMGILAIASLYVISNAAVLIYILIVYRRKFVLPKMEIDLNFWKSNLKEALPMAVTSIFGILIFKIDTIILSLMQSATAVGWYNAAYRLLEALLFFPSVYTTSVFPVLSNMYISSKKPIKSAYEKSFKYLTMISLPIAVGTTLLAEPIILLIYKSTFTESILTLQILIWVIPFTFLNYILGSLLTSMDRQKTVLKITIVSLVFNVGLNLVVIPKYSYLGASVITVLTDIISFVLNFYVVSKLVSKVSIHKFVLKPILACFVMALFIIYVKMNLFIVIIISTVIYFLVLILIKAFSPEDYSLLKQIVKRD